MIDTTSPFSTVMLMSFSTSSLPKCLLRCSVRIIDIGRPPYRYRDSRFSTLPKTKVKKAVIMR